MRSTATGPFNMTGKNGLPLIEVFPLTVESKFSAYWDLPESDRSTRGVRRKL